MVNVIKADGTREPFDDKKFLSSMARAGVPSNLREKLLAKTKNRLYDNIETWEIYQGLRADLKNEPKLFLNARYGLKQAVMLLGPTGYPFEDFLAKILEREGYSTAVRQTLNGKCVVHEIDVVAEKDGRKIMVEAKFHNNPGARSDLQVAMYTKARFDDLKVKNELDHCMLITNTKASVDALSYAACENYQIVSWDHPEGQSLREIIERYKLYPLTILGNLPAQSKMRLLTDHFVLCQELVDNPNLIRALSLSPEEKKSLEAELEYLLHSPPAG